MTRKPTYEDLEKRIRFLEEESIKGKRAEEALRESEEKYRTLVEQANEAIIIAQNGLFVFANRRMSDLLGVPVRDLEGKPFIDFVWPEDRELVIANYMKRIAGETVRDAYDFRIIGAGGRLTWVFLSAAAIRWKGKTATLNLVTDITERKRAEEALQESEKRFATIFNTQQNGIIIIDPETHTVIDANAAALHMIGVTREEAIGHECHKFICPAERGMCPITDLGIDVDNSERVLIKKDHTALSILKTVSRLKLDGKNCLIESFIDITERKRAEELLREQESKLSSIFRAAPVGIGMVINRFFQQANDTLCQITGYSREELLGRNARMLYPTQEDFNYVGQEKYRQIGEKSTGTVETRWKRKDGTVIDIILSSTPLDPDDLAKGVTFTALDITDRKIAEQALRASEERFRALSENAPDIIYTMNLEGVITYVNPSWKRVLEHNEEDLRGRYFTDFAREEDRRTYRKLFKSIRDDGKSVNNYIGVMLTKKGEERVFNMNSAFNRDSEGRIIGVVGTMKDITDLRDMEKKLGQAQKMESIGTLAGGIAHDFNNLLMGIQGYASLMLLDIDTSHPHYERLKRMEQLVGSGADLTKQLLGFARGGRYEVKATDMNDVLKKTSSMFGRTKKEITIHRKYGRDLWSVEVDRGQMEQVFMNLYVNAWQAMPGGGEIYLETENVLLDDEQAFPYAVKPGRYVKITVTDTGTGMDEKTKERIFDPFFTTKGMGRGTGLGLATVYGIIKGHRGMINVYSEPGHGTTFSLYLPASEKAVEEEKTSAGAIARGTEAILLVDDEKMILEVSRELLESMGYRVYAAGSGQEAIAVYMEKRRELDLVILDMIMPGMSGGETYDRLKEIDPDIRVLLSSGYSINGQAQTIMDRGCSGFLQKPFQLENLSRKVREILA